MCVVIDSDVIIANVYYAYFKKSNQCKVLDYKYFEEYKKCLYKKIVKKYKYVMFSDSDSNYIDIQDHIFIKENRGIRCLSSIDNYFIKKVNSIYPNDIQQLIQITREEIKIGQ